MTVTLSTHINAITNALEAFLSFPIDEAKTDAALIDALIAQYNTQYPDDTISRDSDNSGIRHLSSNTRYRDLLLKALQSDTSGGAFMALRLPELKRSLSNYKLSPEAPASALHATLSQYHHLRTLIAQITAAAPYQAFLAAVESIYAAAVTIMPAVAERFNAQQLAEDYPEIADIISRELKQCNALTLYTAPDDSAVYGDTLSEQLNEWIIRVGSEDELLQVTQAAPLGFTLIATIIEGDVAASYFSLLCKTASRSVLFQDKLNTVYPGQHTRRRNDRAHERRINKSPFPYTLLDLDISDKGRSITAAGNKKDIIPSMYRDVRILASVREIDPQELIELLTCIRFVIADWDSINAPLLAQPAQALLSYQPSTDVTQLPALVSKAPITLPWDKMTTHQLTSEVYTALEHEAGLSAPTRNWVAEQSLPAVLAEMEEQSLIRSDGTALIFDPKYGTPTGLSTESRVKADLVYLARCEQAEKIHAAHARWKAGEIVRTRQWLADQLRDSARLRQEMIDPTFWGTVSGMMYGGNPYCGRVDLPLDALAFYQEHLNLLGFAHRYDSNAKDPLANMTEATYPQRSYCNTVWLHDEKKSYHQGFGLPPESMYLSDGTPFVDPKLNHLPQRNIRCAFSDAPAEFFFSVRFEGKFAVAAFTGTPWQELPPLLRTLGDHPYLGNSILQRTDPLMDKSLWESRRPFIVTIGVSMAILNQLRAEAGLPKLSKSAIKAFIKAKREEKE